MMATRRVIGVSGRFGGVKDGADARAQRLEDALALQENRQGDHAEHDGVRRKRCQIVRAPVQPELRHQRLPGPGGGASDQSTA
ncbi:hypothetical protein E6W36_02510 [Hankyongella ginsenosidimutans]|uniref:Uncharacterized protein n=1 Tax=Hankyongella ginsenosidimutans TaxID=1763828 RepID=A0A4D7C847_9SPHN|nr:hypothetical protein E6W36_02510 [Hankyongella ginsenosidimutans]